MTSDVTRRLLSGWALLILSVFVFSATDAAAQTSATLTGTVVNAQNGSPLPGANVALYRDGTTTVAKGTSTNPDGTFRIDGIEPDRYVVTVRFVGYAEREITITLEAGASRALDLELKPETKSLETVIVSASRRQEKVLDAPASISVLEPEQIQSQVNTSSVEAIRSAPGVDMAQTGIDRREVVLRGFNEAFSGSAYVLTDYREAAVPSLAVNVHSLMPNMSVDVERIEVVRGPGSALYGPGVDSGVIHYFTKGPFQHPGTTISVAGGTRQYLAGQFRSAGTLTDNLGWKVTGQFARANEWELNPSDTPDLKEIQRYREYQSRDQIPDGRNVEQGDFDDDGNTTFRLRREDIYQKFNVNGLLQYRPTNATTISLNGGYSELKGVVQSGIGTLQADGFGYSYGQLRLRSGGLFAQVYLNANDAGTNTYVYGSGDTIADKGLQWNGQAQYDFALSQLSTQVIAGADADITVPRTSSEILGRNEGNDRIEKYGSYVQTTTDLTEAFELTLAGRLDYNNVVADVQLSPRAALVYKLTPTNTLRATYNRSFSSPGTNSNFLDIEAQRQALAQVPGRPNTSYNLVFQGLGAADGYTFNDYRDDGMVRFSLPVPGFFKQDFQQDNLPLYPMHAVVANQVLVRNEQGVGFTDQVAQQLSQLDDQQRTALASIFGLLAQNQSAFSGRTLSASAVQLGIPDDSPDGFNPVDGPIDIPPLGQTTTQTFEVGYKGAFEDRIIVNIDGYYERKEDFIGPLVVESPLAYLQGSALTEDVAGGIEAILNNTSDPEIQSLVSQLRNSGIAPVTIGQIFGSVIGGGLAGTPTAVVQPDQQVLPNETNTPTNVGGFLSYRNFGQVEYWGIDASVQVQATEQLDAFANVSIVSDDFFDNKELDEEGTSLSLALNAPSFKAKGGIDYQFDESGLSVGTSGNYVEGFPVETGPYVGEVESYFLLDAHLGYDLSSIPGLSANLTVKNVLNNEHREFVGAPELGRLFMGRLTYTLP